VLPGIKVPAEAAGVTISANGIVSASYSATSGQTTELGRIELARFANPAGLQAVGQNLHAATAASGEAATGFPQDEGMGRLQQGYLEGSNVEIVQEMVDMITAMRAYEINSKAIKNSESMADIANNLVR
jgi:flagellar basal-body rod protein FlgG